jgi:signal transduction histidine kinase
VLTAASALLARSIVNRRFQAKVRALEQQTALERERARIGRDLHDDLGGALTQVALMLDLAGRESTNGVSDRLTQCSAMVRQVAKSVDEIIWAVNPRNDTVPYLVDYLSQFVVEFLHSADIRCRVDLPNRLPDRKVSPEARHNLFLAVKETLANIVRHAHATQVELHITADDSTLSVRIEDNGCGFDRAPDNSTSDGLRNMRDRMAEIGGQFDITSRRGGGTQVSLVCRWEREGAGKKSDVRS